MTGSIGRMIEAAICGWGTFCRPRFVCVYSLRPIFRRFSLLHTNELSHESAKVTQFICVIHILDVCFVGCVFAV